MKVRILLTAILAVLLWLVHTGRVAADPGVEIVDRWVDGVRITPTIVDVRCDGHVAVWYTLRPTTKIAKGTNRVSFWLNRENGPSVPLLRPWRSYGDLDGIVRGSVSDVWSTRTGAMPEGSRLRWHMSVVWEDPASKRGFTLGWVSGRTTCTSSPVSAQRWDLTVTRRGQNLDNVAVTILEGEAPWIETRDGGKVHWLLSDDRGQSRYFLLCLRQGPEYWIVPAGPFRPTPELIRDGAFSLSLTLDGLAGVTVGDTWWGCLYPGIDWRWYQN